MIVYGLSMFYSFIHAGEVFVVFVVSLFFLWWLWYVYLVCLLVNSGFGCISCSWVLTLVIEFYSFIDAAKVLLLLFVRLDFMVIVMCVSGLSTCLFWVWLHFLFLNVHSMCCTWFAPRHLSIHVGDSSLRSEEIVTNLKLCLSMRSLLWLLPSVGRCMV